MQQSPMRRKGRSRAPSPGVVCNALVLVHEMAAAVLLPAAFVRLCAERLFFAVAVRFDAVATDSRLNKRVLHSVGAAGSEGQIVLGGAAFIAVTFDGDVNSCVLLEELRIGLDRRLVGS